MIIKLAMLSIEIGFLGNHLAGILHNDRLACITRFALARVSVFPSNAWRICLEGVIG